MDDIVTLIDIINHHFPHDSPTTASCLTAAMTKRNLYVAIHTLPTEVLVEIIRSAASDRQLDLRKGVIMDPDLLRNLSSLSLVCRLWKDVIDNTGSLWAFLAADTRSLRPLEMAIARSGGVPVVVTLGRSRMNIKDFVTTISPLIHSCRVLCFASTFGAGLEYGGVYNLVQQPSPILEELHLEGQYNGFVYRGGSRNKDDIQNPRERSTKIWVLENNPERLKVLRLRHVDWGWNRLALSNLRDLKLSFMTISASELFDCLLGAPRLESFHVERLSEDWTMGGPGPIAQPISLSSLHRIRMDDVSTAFAHHILSNIIPSSLKNFILSTTSWTGPVPFTGTTSTYRSLLQSVVTKESTNKTVLCVGPRCLCFLVPDQGDNSDFDINGVGLSTPTQHEECARWLSSLWAPIEPKSPLRIVFGRWGIIQPTIIPLHVELILAFLTLDNVMDLCIGFQVSNVHLLYELLSRPIRLESGKWSWGFPKLKTLFIEGQSRSEESLVQMLQARYTAMVTEDSGDFLNRLGESEATATPPTRLQTLTVVRGSLVNEHWREAQNERLKWIVGDEHFIGEVEDHGGFFGGGWL